jgi:hypothetical protein
MKTMQKLHQTIALGTIALGLSLSLSVGQAQNTNPTNTFDTSASLTSMVVWWGPPNPTVTWDSTLDAANDSGSGSARYTENFTPAINEQFMTHFTIANRWGWDNGYTLDATTYTNLSFDIKVDPASYPNVNNNYGNLVVGLTTKTSWDNRIYPPAYTIPLSATNWTHVNIPVNPSWTYLNEVVGFFINMWSGADHTNTLIFNIDNVMLTKPTAPVVIPPPTLSLEPAKSGLKLFTTQAGGPNGRQNIHPPAASHRWMDVPNPVSYKITIKDYPTTPTGFQTHLFLAPAADLPYGANDTSLDWNATNVVFVQIQNIPTGGQIRFMYKTNYPNGFGGQIFGSNMLAQIDSTTMKGTWTLTFSDNTNVSLTTPDNTTTNFVMQPDAAAAFASPVYAWIGAQANGTDKVGLSSLIERIQLTGFPSGNIDDTFPGPGLDANNWVVAAADNAGIQVVPSSTAYWLNWTVPDSGFSAQTSPGVAPSAWANLGLPTVLIDAKRRVQIPASSASSSYFRLIKREFAKLQVLMPGETAAPGTPSGKTGTPIQQTANTSFFVTVNAVDANWYPISGISHTLHFTSTDTGAFLPLDGPLSNGTGSFEMQFGNSGTWTVTASDVTDPTKGPDTGSPTTVP